MPGELAITVPAEDPVPGSTVDVRLTLNDADGKALRLAASPHGQVVAGAVRATDDGLRLAYADDLVVYQRIRAGTLAAPRQ